MSIISSIGKFIIALSDELGKPVKTTQQQAIINEINHLRQSERILQNQLDNIRSMYTQNHPEMVWRIKEINSIRNKIKKLNGT